jgi:hypothetical protein
MATRSALSAVKVHVCKHHRDRAPHHAGNRKIYYFSIQITKVISNFQQNSRTCVRDHVKRELPTPTPLQEFAVAHCKAALKKIVSAYRYPISTITLGYVHLSMATP